MSILARIRLKNPGLTYDYVVVTYRVQWLHLFFIRTVLYEPEVHFCSKFKYKLESMLSTALKIKKQTKKKKF